MDILRGMAILLVLGRHLPEGTQPMQGWLVAICRFWYRIGWSGVDLFFVLSGFLVSRLLFLEYKKNGPIDLGRFLIRRGFRIWPAYYVMTFLTLPFVFSRVRPGQILSEMFFLQSYIIHIWDHTWSLAVEEHFYLLFGALAWFLSRRRGSDAFSVLRGIWVAAALGCLVMRLFIPYGDAWPFARTHLRIDALLFGVLLSYYEHSRGEAVRRIFVNAWFVWAALAAFLLSPMLMLQLGEGPFLSRFGLVCVYAGYGLLMMLAHHADSHEKGFLGGMLSWVGVRSYSIYLWHLPLAFLLAQPLARRTEGAAGLYSAIILYLCGSVLLGWASFVWVEKPFLAFRDRRYPGR